MNSIGIYPQTIIEFVKYVTSQTATAAIANYKTVKSKQETAIHSIPYSNSAGNKK